MKEFDYIIIGTGQAGTPLAFSLAKKGKVAIIEKSLVGGTCVNNGCVPTKAYVASARRMWDSQHGEDLGIEIPAGAKANLEKIKARKETFVNASRNGIEKGFADNENITFYRAEAYFVSDYEIMVNDEKITAKNIFINVGARAVVPEEYKKIDYLTNISILELTTIPKHLVIVGGSYIGLEFGQMFKRFGSDVTILERGDRLIKREDDNISEAVAKIMQDEEVDVLLNAKEIAMSQDSSAITIAVNKTTAITASHVLLAIGRQPNTDTLKLENTNIEVSDKGMVTVDDFCRTNVDGIFAIGDCNGNGGFTHTSYNDFQIVEAFLLDKEERKISDRITTYGLFIDPPLGRVGLTKQQAIDKGYDILIANRPMSRIARAKEKGETQGFMEAIIDAKTSLILGASVLGVGGDETINGFTNLMYAKQPYTVFRDGVHIHPTVTELIPTMLESLSPPKK